MAFRPLFSGVRLSSDITVWLPRVAVERSHLLDTLVGLCELHVASGGNQIAVEANARGDEVCLTLSIMLSSAPDLVGDRKVEFYTATLHLYGAQFAIHREEGPWAAVLHLPVADCFDAPVV